MKAIMDERFLSDLLLTYKYAAICVLLQLVFGLVISLTITSRIVSEKMRNITLSILIAPLLFPYVAVGQLFRLILSTDFGLVNYILNVLGMQAPDWFGNASTAFLSIVLIDVWQNTSFFVLLLTAAILSIPTDYYEAAAIDGAGPIQTFKFITLPYIYPAIFFAVIFRFLGSLKAWDYVAVTTYGGPGTATELISWYTTFLAFYKYELSYSTAVAWIFNLTMLVLTLLLIRIVWRR